MKFPFSIYIVAITVLLSCNKTNNADAIIYNAKIYTVDSAFSVVEAMVIKDKKIVATGKYDDLAKRFDSNNKIDAKGKTIFPGLIDAHAHFLGYGLQLNTVNLVGAKSWDEVVQRVALFYKDNKIKDGEWITGRGWDQNDWEDKDFPTNTLLNEKFSKNPVLLKRIDGHAAIANEKALNMTRISPGPKMSGGNFGTKNGKLTGLLVDNAVDIVEQVIPQPTKEQKQEALLAAQKNCFAVGLTTVDDCGINYDDVELVDELQKKKQLKMKVYAMLSDDVRNYEYLFKKKKIQTEYLTVNSFKVYGDGALGSRGACLLSPYQDKSSEHGFLLSSKEHFDSIANIIYANQFQMCTHAIGDSANRVILDIYAKYLKTNNDLRWRIEHAQVVNANDFSFFGKYSIIPSVQPTHATSDMYWAKDRLGPLRVKGAYAFKDLLAQNQWIPLGTDFPVEDISPFKTFYASVIRKDASGFPNGGFQIENALTREQTIRGLTIWAAKSNFEESFKGSLEAGKYADFIIVDTDLMTCNETDILTTQVLQTWVSGEKVWGDAN